MPNPFKRFDGQKMQQAVKDRVADSVQNARTNTAGIGFVQWVAIVVCILCVAVIVGSIVSMMNAQTEYTSFYETNMSEISRLNAELTNYENAEVQTPEQLEASVVSAYENGARVAYLQNTYFDISVATQLDAWRENMTALAVYFDENTTRGQEPWFSPDMRANYTKLTWQFVSDVTSAAESFPVVWLCRNENDRLVAFALGQYHADIDKFSDITVTITSFGADNYMETIDLSETDPTGEQPYEEYNPVDVPDGYHLEVNEDGTTSIVDESGQVYDGDSQVEGVIIGPDSFTDDSGSEFAEDFQDAVNGRIEAFQNGGASE